MTFKHLTLLLSPPLILLSYCEEYFTYVLPYVVLEEKNKWNKSLTFIRMDDNLWSFLLDSLYVFELICSCQQGIIKYLTVCTMQMTKKKKKRFTHQRHFFFLTFGTRWMLFLVTFYFRGENMLIFKYIDVNKCCLLSTTSFSFFQLCERRQLSTELLIVTNGECSTSWLTPGGRRAIWPLGTWLWHTLAEPYRAQHWHWPMPQTGSKEKSSHTYTGIFFLLINLLYSLIIVCALTERGLRGFVTTAVPARTDFWNTSSFCTLPRSSCHISPYAPPFLSLSHPEVVK